MTGAVKWVVTSGGGGVRKKMYAGCCTFKIPGEKNKTGGQSLFQRSCGW